MKRHLEDVVRGCCWVASAFVLGVLISSEAVAAKLIAVLPLDTRDTDGKMSKAAQHSLEEMLRDVTVIQLLDATKAYLHAVIDNFSRKILGWKIAAKEEPQGTVDILVHTEKLLNPGQSPRISMDSGVENKSGVVDAHCDGLALAYGGLQDVRSRGASAGARTNATDVRGPLHQIWISGIDRPWASGGTYAANSSSVEPAVTARAVHRRSVGASLHDSMR
jgi:hypothetical protein